ncbi:MAG: hypothetical protein P8Y34_08805 [Anaerolineales bacterium]
MSEDIFFQPNQFTPEDAEIEILDLSVELFPDRRRLNVKFRLSGFRKSMGPSITLIDQAGEEIASANIVNIFIPQNEITLHIPGSHAKPGKYTLVLSLFTLQEIESELEPGKVGDIRTDPLDQKSIPITLQ